MNDYKFTPERLQHYVTIARKQDVTYICFRHGKIYFGKPTQYGGYTEYEPP